ncbi:MAG: endonuclease/exonuclease/phosphatase family protein [Chloroflexota bacterium]|nr:endonuclease/exonuclease/phosphatase family protein [Chloroflexota bacterium]
MTAFTLMTWNVQNLFLPTHDSGPDNERLFQRKLESLAKVIDHANPDVLALQEIGPDGVLTRLQSVLTHPMPHIAEGLSDRRGIRVATLATVPIQSSHQLRQFPNLLRPIQIKDIALDDPQTPGDDTLTVNMGRGALEVVVTVDGTQVTILNAHFKSKLINYARKAGVVPGDPFIPNNEGERNRYAAYALYLRTGEALTVRERLNQLLADPERPTDIKAGTGKRKAVIFCGDLNDETEAATTQIIQGPSGSEVGTHGFGRSDSSDGYRMWNLAPLLPDVDGEPAYTRRYKGRGELIDHIFASHKLVNPRNLPTARTIMLPDPLPDMGDDPDERKNEPGSDHAAVVATFEL